MKSTIALLFGLCLTLLSTEIATAETVWLDELNLALSTQGWGTSHKNKSVAGNMLTIGGDAFVRGFGTHAESTLRIDLDCGARSFSGKVGVDDEVNKDPQASVEFIVQGDGQVLWQSGIMRAGDAAKPCNVNVVGVKTLILEVTDADGDITSDHADWADASIEMIEGKPIVVPNVKPEAIAPYILTPAAPATPRINGANVFGVRPGSPFMFTIPATGDRPMTFYANHLPPGLKLDAKSGRITGKLTNRGEFVVTFFANNSLGKAEKKFRIVCGDQIALTPPMGWNSWNCFARSVSEEKVKSAAAAMVSSGLINHGWTYINIDDYWQNHRDSKDPTLRGPIRDTQGNIVPNARFPDMKGLADYIHSLGLKAGLYSSPGPWTCGGCAGSFDYEEQDAMAYSKWGFDYLKYDWCSYSSEMESQRHHSVNYSLSDDRQTNVVTTKYLSLIRPYAIMHSALTMQKRDITFSFSLGGDHVWEWGSIAGGNCWRTTGDINDTWKSMSNIGFNQDMARPYAKPGNWNDPDMLVVGEIGWGDLRPSRLTPNEQYTHISLWCLLSAPLLIGCDMTKLNEFTLSLLENDEVLALNQDALGKEATCILQNGDLRVYEKQLEDGGHAIGFFNLDQKPLELNFSQFALLGLTGKQLVRDLWRQKDVCTVDTANGILPITIPGHGVVLYKLSLPAK